MVDALLTQTVCVFLIFLFWFLSLVPIRMSQRQHASGLDNSNPRKQYLELNEMGQRAVAIHQNSFEALVIFVSAVLVSLVLGGDADWAAALSIIFVISRVIYAPLYHFNLATARSIIWVVGIIAIVGLYINAFNVYDKRKNGTYP